MIDAHIHLDDSRFDKDRSNLMNQARKIGVEGFVVPSVGVWNFEKVNLLASSNKDVFAAFGLHPYFIDKHEPEDLSLLESWLDDEPCVALGECGLDFYLKELDKNKQIEFFVAQIELAKKYNLPLILHARGAVEEVFNSLKKVDYFNATIHSYNGSIQQTKKLIDRGVVFSFGGAICNPRAKKIHELIKYIPPKHLMFETDAPDQNLYPDHKLRNTPTNLLKVIEAYSRITKSDIELAMINSREVTQNFFKLSSIK